MLLYVLMDSVAFRYSVANFYIPKNPHEVRGA
jgi:hypothetical protein